MYRVVRHHVPIALGATIALIVAADRVGGDTSAYRWSMATAYVSLLLLVITLSLGPLLALRTRRIPTSFDLRRDCGIWAGLVGIGHAAVGLFVHMGDPLLYFFGTDSYPERLVLRQDAFGFANYAGLAAAGILFVLLATSSDAVLKRLGRDRWKSVQRSAYGLLVLTAVHGAVYQVLESRPWRLVLLFGGLVFAVAAAQASGVYKRRMQARPQ